MESSAKSWDGGSGARLKFQTSGPWELMMGDWAEEGQPGPPPSDCLAGGGTPHPHPDAHVGRSGENRLRGDAAAAVHRSFSLCMGLNCDPAWPPGAERTRLGPSDLGCTWRWSENRRVGRWWWKGAPAAFSASVSPPRQEAERLQETLRPQASADPLQRQASWERARHSLRCGRGGRAGRTQYPSEAATGAEGVASPVNERLLSRLLS